MFNYPLNKGFIIPLFCYFLVYCFLVVKIQPPSSENRNKLTEAGANDQKKKKKKTDETIQIFY